MLYNTSVWRTHTQYIRTWRNWRDHCGASLLTELLPARISKVIYTWFANCTVCVRHTRAHICIHCTEIKYCSNLYARFTSVCTVYPMKACTLRSDVCINSHQPRNKQGGTWFKVHLRIYCKTCPVDGCSFRLASARLLSSAIWRNKLCPAWWCKYVYMLLRTCRLCIRS